VRAGITLSLRAADGSEHRLPRTLAPRGSTPAPALSVDRSAFASGQYLTGDGLPRPGLLVLSGPMLALGATTHLAELRELEEALAGAVAIVARTDGTSYRLDLLSPPGWLTRTPSGGRANASLVRLTLVPRDRRWLVDATGLPAGITL
jgi:hypothetical protein